MSLDDLNREQKRLLKKQGQLDEKGAPKRAVRESAPERVGPKQYLNEVGDEMRKVAWPTRDEVVRYSIVVTVTVLFYAGMVAGLDLGLGEIAGWFY